MRDSENIGILPTRGWEDIKPEESLKSRVGGEEEVRKRRNQRVMQKAERQGPKGHGESLYFLVN